MKVQSIEKKMPDVPQIIWTTKSKVSFKGVNRRRCAFSLGSRKPDESKVECMKKGLFHLELWEVIALG